jgi:hypothetical protein
MTDSIYYQFSRYTQPPLIVLGTMGAVFNQILFFCRKPLRTTSCSLYFRALSINDLLVLYIYVLLQWLLDQQGFDPTKSYNWYCKMKQFLTVSLYTLSPYFVVLACFDRLCTSSTNVRLRRIASIRIASYLIPCMVIFIFTAYFHVPVWYGLVVTSKSASCTVVDPIYNKFYSLFLVILLAVIPPVLMVIFCVITMVFLRQQRRRVMPVNQARLRQRDNQILKMLFIYVGCHLTCTIPFSVLLIIIVFQLPAPSALNILLCRLFILLFNVSFSTSFYIYKLGTPFYRHELCNLINSIKGGILRKLGRNHDVARLHTTGTTTGNRT